MTYQEAIDFLFTATPVFQDIGAVAYKPGLERMLALDKHYESPHKAFKTIHVGGTNGKGSTSHTLSAILQESGYRVGLFTSPHLIDFRERIRVNGIPISKEYVCQFTEDAQYLIETHHPSFFELTSMMALKYFKDEQVDIAIIEVGLGGRLDSTNIITPILSIITNISLDHTQYLGDTLSKIAYEKAGIIKAQTPIIIGQVGNSEVKHVFLTQAMEVDAPILFSEEQSILSEIKLTEEGYLYTTIWGEIHGVLSGEAQKENTRTILSALRELKKTLNIPFEAIQKGFSDVTTLTGLLGRWQTLSERPKIICDTGHNEAGIRTILTQLHRESRKYENIYVILGMASDKDVQSILKLFPPHYHYCFTEASVQRALPYQELYTLAQAIGLKGLAYPNVVSSLLAVQKRATPNDLIFIGGSNFIVADLLREWDKIIDN